MFYGLDIALQRNALEKYLLKMGCAFSRNFEENPRIFHVWNVDSDGHYLKPGKIEVTDSQLILYQKPNLVVQWPLTRIRRYGFDSEVFSFECGRRCATGAGVYAFKCKRAQQLFTILQESINKSGSNSSNNNATVPVTASTPTDNLNNSVSHSLTSERAPPISLLPNGNLNTNGSSSPPVDSDGYLEPITASSFIDQVSATSNDTAIPVISPGSYVCIHGSSDMILSEGLASEWPTISAKYSNCCSFSGCAGRSINASPSAHHYVNNVVVEQSASCSNSMCIVNQYVNSPMITDKFSPEQNANTYVNSAMVTLSTGHLPCSGGCCAINCNHCVDFNTNYAKLDKLLKQEQSVKQCKDQHCYVNVKPEPQSESSASSKCVSGRSTPTELNNKRDSVTLPTSPISVRGLSMHCYANVGSPTSSESGTAKDQDQVNYAVLDLEQTESSNASAVISPVSAQNSVHSLVSSPAHSPEGYAQIDFDKTKALSNSANPCTTFNDDSMRKTRHNAVIPCVSNTA